MATTEHRYTRVAINDAVKKMGGLKMVIQSLEMVSDMAQRMLGANEDKGSTGALKQMLAFVTSALKSKDPATLTYESGGDTVRIIVE